MIAPERGKSKKLTLTSTVPIACDDGINNCDLLVELHQTNDQAFNDYCALKFKPGKAGQTQEFNITAKRDFVDDGDKIMIIKLKIIFNIGLSDWNKHIAIPNIKVR